MFDAEQVWTVVASRDGLCDGYPVTRFLPGENKFQVDFSSFTLENNSTGYCPETFDLYSFGFISGVSGNSFSVSIDGNSIIVALAINMGILHINDIQVVSAKSFYTTFPMDYCNSDPLACSGLNATSYSPYSSPLNKLGMDRIHCIQWSNGTTFYDFDGSETPFASTCFIQIGSMVLIPSLIHWYKDECDCSVAYDDYLETLCNQPIFLLSMYYSKNETLEYFPKTLEVAARNAFRLRTYDDDDYFNQLMWSTAYESMGGNQPDYVANDTLLYNAYEELCPNNTCSSIVFLFESFYRYNINDYDFDLLSASCSDFSYDIRRFQELNKTRSLALPLIQNYFTCYNTPFSAVTYAIGISTGNAGVAATAIMFIAYFVLGRYLFARFRYSTRFIEELDEEGSPNKFVRRKGGFGGAGKNRVVRAKNMRNDTDDLEDVRQDLFTDKDSLLEQIRNQDAVIKSQNRKIRELRDLVERIADKLDLPDGADTVWSAPKKAFVSSSEKRTEDDSLNQSAMNFFSNIESK